MSQQINRQRQRLVWVSLSLVTIVIILCQPLLVPVISVTQPMLSAGCLGSTHPQTAQIAWNKLKNPIVQFEHRAVKDMAVHLVDGTWQMMFSYISENPFRFQIGLIQSRDWSEWSTHAVQVWDRASSGGLASPDIVQAPDGTYVVTFNSHTYDTRDRRGTVPNTLYYRTSSDFKHWSDMQRLLGDRWAGRNDRFIDAALAYTAFGLVAGMKKDQTFQLAYAPTGALEGPWKAIGQPKLPSGLENYQFLQIDGVWHLLGTTLRKPSGYDVLHMPALYKLTGDPNKPEGWLKWQLVRVLDIPQADWNGGNKQGSSYERANSAYLCDARPVDGYFYLFYAGSNETKRFNGRGHTAIGVARSTDLITWKVPETEAEEQPTEPNGKPLQK